MHRFFQKKIWVLCLSVSQVVFADTLTWNPLGGGSTIWSNSAKWMSSGAHTIPQSGDSLVFSNTSLNSTNDLTAGLTFPSITISGAISGSVTGNQIALNNSTFSFHQTSGSAAFIIPINLVGTSMVDVNSGLTGLGQCTLGSISGISGTGGIFKTGAGTLTISSGTHSYSGTTEVSAGVIEASGYSPNSPLIIDSGAKYRLEGSVTVPSLSGSGTVEALATGATFTVNQTISDTTFDGVLTGPYDFTKSGSFKLTLTGTSPVSQVTRVTAGTLDITGSGSLSGTTSVGVSPGATLNVDGTINTSASGIGVDGTLSGTGTVCPVTIQSGAISLESTDLLNVHGNYTQQATGTYVAEITAAGQASKIAVSATANIDGTLNLVPGAGPYTPGTSYTLLTANSLTGTYDIQLTAGSSGLTPDLLTLSYPNNTVVLTIASLTPPSPTPIPTENIAGNDLVLANYLNSNPVAAYLLSIPAGAVGGAYTLLLELPDEELSPALAAINPSRATAASFTGQNTLFNLSKIVSFRTASQHLFEMAKRIQMNAVALNAEKQLDGELIAANDLANFWPSLKKKEVLQEEETTLPLYPSPYSFWMTGFGYFAEQDAQNENPKFNALTGGLILGVERNYLDLERSYLSDCLLGGALSYNRTSLNQGASLGEGIIDGGYGSFYGTAYLNNGLYMDFSFWGNYQRIENTRNVFYPGYSAVSKSAHNSYGGDLHGALGYDSHFKRGRAAIILEPYAAVDWAFQSEEGYAEYGSNDFNMNIESRFSSMLRLDVGLNNYFTWVYNWGIFTWRGTFSYVKKFPFNTGTITASIVGAPGSFTATSFTETQEMFSPSVEFSWRTTQGGSFSLLYDGEFGSGYITNEVALKVGKDF